MSWQTKLLKKFNQGEQATAAMQQKLVETGSPQSPPTPAPTQPKQRALLNPQQEQVIQRALVKEFETSFGKIDRTFAEVTPTGTIANAGNMTHNRYTALQNAWNTTVNYFAATAGNDYLGTYITTMGYTDDQTRQSTLAALHRIIQGHSLTPQEAAGPTGFSYRGNYLGEPLNADLFREVVTDTSRFEQLNARQKAEFIRQAQSVVQYERAHGNQAAAIERAVAAVATGDLTEALNSNEAAQLTKWVQRMKRFEGEGIADMWAVGEALGAPTNINLDGTDNDIITIDPEWAERHPAKAAAEAHYLQQQFPTATIRFGGGGIAAAIFNDIGKPVDAILAVPSALIATNIRGLRRTFDNGDPEQLQAEREELVEKLRTAPLDKRADLLNGIANIDDRLHILQNPDAGTFAEMDDLVEHALHQDTANLGFAENIVQSTGLLPGDGGYNVALATTMIAGSVVADPTMWMAGVATGAKAAATIPRILGAADTPAYAVRGVIARAVWRRMALTPEEFMDSAVGMGAVDNIVTASTHLDDVQYDAWLRNFYADDDAVNILKAAGSDPEAVKQTMYSLLSGYTEAKNIPALAARANELGRRINDADAVAGQMRQLKNAAYEAQYAKRVSLQNEIERLKAIGMEDTPELLALEDELRDLLDRGLDIPAPRRPMTPEEFKATGGTFDVPPGWLRSNATNKNPRTAENLANDIGPDGERGYESVRRSIAEEGWNRGDPLTVDYDYKTGGVEITDGTHRLAIAEEMDLPTIPVNFRGNADWKNLQRYIAEQFPEQATVPIADAESIIASRTADKAELLHLNSLLKGQTRSAMPINYGDVAEMRKHGNTWARAIADLSEDLPGFPTNRIDNLPLLGEMNKRAKGLMRKLRTAFNPSGFEGAEAAAQSLARTVYLPGTSISGEHLVDAFNQSRKALWSMGRTLGLTDEQITKYLGQWGRLLRANDANESFKWLKEYWKFAVMNSPRIKSNGLKANILKLWDSHYDQFGSDVVRTSRPGEVLTTENVLNASADIVGPNGEVLPVGKPVFSADWLSEGVQMPALNEILEAIHPRAAKVLNGSTISKMSGFWKRAVLLTKLPFALPGRIMGELALARMSAYDHAALGNWGFMRFFRSVRGTGEFADVAEVPYYALGAMLNEGSDLGNYANQATKFGQLAITDGRDYYRALAGRMAHLGASPEVAVILDAATPEEYIAALQRAGGRGALGRAGRHYEGTKEGLELGATRVWNYVHNDMLGSGPFASDLRSLLRGGKADELGTVEFADRMDEAVRAGQWTPGVSRVHGKYAVGLKTAEDFQQQGGRFSQFMFRWFYAKPEMLLRRGAYRQSVTNNLRRLTAMGYPDDVAIEIARASAARGTADEFFKIGAHTSGEYWMRNVSPFFPAWREVTDTWLFKLPERLGGGSKIIGAAYMLRRAQLMEDVLTQTGVLGRDAYGSRVLRVPGLNALLNGVGDLLGKDEGTDWNTDISFDSLFGIMPFPDLDAISGNDWTAAVNSMLPGIGGAPGLATQLVANATLDQSRPGWQRELGEIIMPFGMGSIGGSVTRMYSGLALMAGVDPIPFWDKFASNDWREQQVHASIIAAQRRLMATGAYLPPSLNDFDTTTPKGRVEFQQAYRQWQERFLRDSEVEAASEYLTRGILGTIIPFTPGLATNEEEDITAIWGLLNAEHLPPEVRDGLASPMLDAFKTAYPLADWYTIGTREKSPFVQRQDPELTDNMQALFEEGLQRIRTPEEYSAWAMGMSSFSTFLTKRAAVYAEFDHNPVDYLLNGDGARNEIAKLDRGWQFFLTAQEEAAHANGETSFREMLNKSSLAKNMSIEDIAAQGLARQLPLIQDAVEEGAYAEMRGAIYESIKEQKRTSDTKEERLMWGTLDKWYENVADPYYAQLDTMYARAGRMPDGAAQGEAYDAIRRYSNSQKPVRINGVRMPTPEQVAFNTKTPEERAGWATDLMGRGHPEWLTDFQLKVTGLDSGKGKKASDFANYVAGLEQEFDRRFPSTSTEGYYDARERLDKVKRAEAQERGLGDMYKLWEAPLYLQVDRAGLTSGFGWDTAVSYAESARKSITGAGYELDSTSPNAYGAQRWLMDNLDKLYRADKSFAQYVDQAATGLGEEDQPVHRRDVFWQIFLDGYGSAPAYLT